MVGGDPLLLLLHVPPFDQGPCALRGGDAARYAALGKAEVAMDCCLHFVIVLFHFSRWSNKVRAVYVSV